MNARASLVGHTLKQKSSRERPFNDAVWAITFSDLITLLFCFFLTMVSFGPLGKAHQAAREASQVPPPAEAVKINDGTSLAISGEGVQRRVFELYREELARIAQGETSETLEVVKRIIESEGYENRRVTITVSPEGEKEWQGERWLSIIQRLSGLQRQVFDAQPKTLLKLRISEPYPAAPPKAGENREWNGVPALIEIEEVSKSNG